MENRDTLFDKIKYFYWSLVPYDYRPKEILYYWKCRIWRKHNTVRARYLSPTWYDRCDLLPHIMFEILSQFIEQECSAEIVEWHGEHGHKINVNGEKKYVRDEMQDLYNWWHITYNKEMKEVEEILWKEVEKHKCKNVWEPTENERFFRFTLQFDSPEDDVIWHRCMMAINKLEKITDKKLEVMMHRLVRISPYMWT